MEGLEAEMPRKQEELAVARLPTHCFSVRETPALPSSYLTAGPSIPFGCVTYRYKLSDPSVSTLGVDPSLDA